MYTVRGETQQDVACDHAFWQVLTALHRAHSKAREIKITLMIHARHFRRLATDQSATRQLATLGDAVNDPCCLFQLQLTRREIVKEKQWLSALADQIVDAHSDQVNADCIDVTCVNRDAQLGTDTVRGRNQNRVFVAGIFKVKQRAKAAEARHHARARCAFCSGFDPLYQRVARVDINASVSISQAFFGHGHHPRCEI